MSNRAIGISGASDVFGLSDNLWGKVATDMIFGFKDRAAGWGVFDDFKNYGVGGTILTSSLGWYSSEGNPYRTFELKGASNSTQAIVPDTSGYYTVPTGYPILTPGSARSPNGGTNSLYAVGDIIPTPGQVTFSPISTTNDQAQIQMGGSTAALNSTPFTPYPLTSMVPMSVYFECRLKFSATLTGLNSFFIGLAGAGAGVTSLPVGASLYGNSASASGCSLLGFGFLRADTTNTLSLVCSKNGAAPSHQSVTSMAGMNVLTFLAGSGDYTKGYKNIGNNVYFKLGFKYDGLAKTLTPYINGIAPDGVQGPNKVVGSGTLSTNLGAAAPGTASTTLWPADPMALAAGLFNYSSSAQTMTLDWWAAAQSYK